MRLERDLRCLSHERVSRQQGVRLTLANFKASMSQQDGAIIVNADLRSHRLRSTVEPATQRSFNYNLNSCSVVIHAECLFKVQNYGSLARYLNAPERQHSRLQ